MSDLVSALRREGKRKRDNMRANGIGHPYVVMVETEAAERIEALEARELGFIQSLRELEAKLKEARLLVLRWQAEAETLEAENTKLLDELREYGAANESLREENAKWRAGELVTSDTAALEDAAQAVVDAQEHMRCARCGWKINEYFG